MDNTVHAYAINDKEILIKCPYCRYHIHGSLGNILDRIEDKVSHCEIVKYNKIIIDKDTMRCSTLKALKKM